MKSGVLTHGDGLVMSITSPSSFTIDQQGFADHPFTPYAVFDPGSGRIYRVRIPPYGEQPERWSAVSAATYRDAQSRHSPATFSQHFRCALGTSESSSLTFVRKERRVRLLNRLTAGYENREGEYTAQRVVGRGSPTTEIWRLADLHWRVASADGNQDLPAYLMNRFLLTRRVAWMFAWVLVRGAYLHLDERNDELISQAESLNRFVDAGGSKAKRLEAAAAAFQQMLKAEIEALKQRELR